MSQHDTPHASMFPAPDLPTEQWWSQLRRWLAATEPLMPRAYCICGQEMLVAESRHLGIVYCSLDCARRYCGDAHRHYAIGGIAA